MNEPTNCESCGRPGCEHEPCFDCGMWLCEMCRSHLPDGTVLCWDCMEEYEDTYEEYYGEDEEEDEDDE
jgi:ribosomal protein L37AE/L43A